MRVAVLSDLHGNPFALDAVLRDVEALGVDELVCLGDIAIGPFPHETIARVRELGCPMLMGNWDSWFLHGVPRLRGEVGPRLSAQGDWCVTRLDAVDLEFMRGFRPTLELQVDGSRLVLSMLPRGHSKSCSCRTSRAGRLEEALQGVHAGLILGGHTHLQMLRRLPDSLFAPGKRRPAVFRRALGRLAARVSLGRVHPRLVGSTLRGSSSGASSTTWRACSRPLAATGSRTPSGGRAAGP